MPAGPDGCFTPLGLPRRPAGPAGGTGHRASSRVGPRRPPVGAGSSSPWPCGAETGQSWRASRASLPSGRQQQERREGRSTAAAFGQPVSGAEHGGRPRGDDMLTFRDNSWYQSGNSGVVRDRQGERQREKERAGAGGPDAAVAPGAPFPFLPGFTTV